MSSTDPYADVISGGYRSNSDKNTYQILILVLAGIAAIGPIIFSFAWSIANGGGFGPFGPGMGPRAMSAFQQPDADSAVVWQERTWLLSEDSGFGDVSLLKQNGEKFDEVASIIDTQSERIRTLVPDDDLLWVVSTDQIQIYQDDMLQPVSTDDPGSDHARFLLSNDELTALYVDTNALFAKEGDDKDNAGTVHLEMVRWNGDEWESVGKYSLTEKIVDEIRGFKTAYVDGLIADAEFEKQASEIPKIEDINKDDTQEDLSNVDGSDQESGSTIANEPRIVRDTVGKGSGNEYGQFDIATITSDFEEYVLSHLQAVNLSGELHLFWLTADGVLLHRTGLPEGGKAEVEKAADEKKPDSETLKDKASGGKAGWQAITLSSEDEFDEFKVTAIGDKLVLLRGVELVEGMPELVGSKIASGSVEELFRFEVDEYISQYQIVAGTGDADYRLFYKDGSGTTAYVDIANGGVSEKTSIGPNFGSMFTFFSKEMLESQIVINSVTYGTLFLFIVSVIVLTKMYRDGVYEVSLLQAQHASLLQRLVAKIIDEVLFWIPVALLGFAIYYGRDWVEFKDFDFDNFDPRDFAGLFGQAVALVAGWFLWLFVFAIALSIMEGMSGKTPGKWVMGIEVCNTELERCGFLRAFARRLLIFIDSFFQYAVGITTIALTEKHQRVGDLAARTIVVRSGTISSADDLEEAEFVDNVF